MKEIVVASGKGGTGKTSITASLAYLSNKKVLADCDVDASNLHILVEAKSVAGKDFFGTKKAEIKKGHCVACGKCEEVCQFGAIYFDGPGNGIVEKTFRVDPIKCEGCGLCYHFCNHNAIKYEDFANGKLYETESKYGPFIHAKLGIGESNSGKLVSEVKDKAEVVAKKNKINFKVIDGAPGIGCPVTASLTGANYVLVVTEPTVSGLHDMKRIAKLIKHFGIDSGLIINRYDLNVEQAEIIEKSGLEFGMDILGRVRYDRTVTEAQLKGKPVVTMKESEAAIDIMKIWNKLKDILEVE